MGAGANLEVTEDRQVGPVALVARIVDFVFYVLTLVLLMRFALELIGAARTSGFFVLIKTISEPFLTPFYGIVGTTNVLGIHVVWSMLVAIGAYALLHAVVRAFFRIVTRS